ETDAEDAFQLPSGEQGDRWSHGTLAVFTAWNTLTALPIFVSVSLLNVYRTRMLETTDSERLGLGSDGGESGIMDAT
ncbi:MAG TPA: hypothetical protein VGN39_13270, partial [Terriglobales bacterium]|nr:hypothetical protein [Terriglobales bacterium]